MKSILVTGANGFVGRHLQKKLESLGFQVIMFVGDIRSKHDFNSYYDQAFNHFIHLASKSFVPDSWKKPDEFLHTNVNGTQNVLEFCRHQNLPLTYLSSYLYGNPKQLPISEEAEINPTNPYALTKQMAETICKFYSEHFGLNITIIRPFNIYGPGQTGVFLIPELIEKFYSEQSIIKVLDTTPKRDYLFIDDLVDLIILTIENTRGYNIFNAGSGYSLSVKEVIDTIAKITKIVKPVESENNVRKNEIANTIADITKAENILGWKPRVNFEEGLIKTIAFTAKM